MPKKTKPYDQLIVGLDPSSVCCGCGVLTERGALVTGLLLLPRHRTSPTSDRVIDLADEVEVWLDRLEPAVILVEWTTGKVGARHKGKGAGLAVYGAGVGAILDRCHCWCRGARAIIHAICENEWTRGVPKRERQLAIAALYPEYAAMIAEDPGGDVADGIGLADWWLREQSVRRCV